MHCLLRSFIVVGFLLLGCGDDDAGSGVDASSGIDSGLGPDTGAPMDFSCSYPGVGSGTLNTETDPGPLVFEVEIDATPAMSALVRFTSRDVDEGEGVLRVNGGDALELPTTEDAFVPFDSTTIRDGENTITFEASGATANFQISNVAVVVRQSVDCSR